MPKSVTIDGVEYVEQNRPDDAKLRIVIVDSRGLTFVGRVSLSALSGDVLPVIYDARCVIRWGTKGHLAQLAAGGPTTTTVLGDLRDVRVAARNIVAVWDCDEEAWANV